MSKKRTVLVRVPRSDNTRAQRTLLIAVGLLIWMNALTIIFLIQSLIQDGPLNPLGTFLIVTSFICLVVGLTAILKVFPPLHHLITVAAIINIVIGIFSSIGVLQAIISALILYIVIRFPIRFEYEKKVLSSSS